MRDAYGEIAGLYHLIFEDWDASIDRQAAQLDGAIKERWGDAATTVLDVSCGIGTQAIGLAKLGYAVTASDISPALIERAKTEARNRGLDIDYSVCDMREAFAHYRRSFDAVISCDNSITHLLTDEDITLALRRMYECTRPGGGCLLTVRDYDKEERGTGIVKDYGVREEDGGKYRIYQVWDFDGDIYDLSMHFVADCGESGRTDTIVMRAKYYAVGICRLMELMREAGFTAVERFDGRFFQPVLLGDRKA